MSARKDQFLIEAATAYLDIAVAPRFALLVNGKWGSGKTHLAESLLNIVKKANRKVIYVSLYGITSAAQIDQLIFQEIHPILSSKKMRFAGRFLTGIIKATIPIPIGGSEVEVALPNLESSDFVSEATDHILFFDDLERCSMSIKDALGYINYFSEHVGAKVLVCANESELLNRQDASDYKVHKEKVFGASLTVLPNFDEALKSFANELSPADLCANVLERSHLIKAVFDQVDAQNLRALRQSLLVFQRIYKVLPEKAKTDNSYFGEFFTLYLLLSLENSISILDAQTIKYVVGTHWITLAFDDQKDQVRSRGQILRAKHESICESDIAQLSPEFWEDFFLRGGVNDDLLNQLVDSHPTFQNSSTPAWQQLWWWYRLEQEKFDGLVAVVRRELEEQKITNAYAMLHACSTILDIVRRGLIPDISPSMWLQQSAVYFSRITEEGYFAGEAGSLPYKLETFSGYAGLGYDTRLPGFEEIVGYAKRALDVCLENQRRQTTMELKEILQVSPSEFVNRLQRFRNSYYAFPLFSRFTVDEFMVSTENYRTVEEWRTLAEGIHSYLESYQNLERDQINFFESLRPKFQEQISSRKGTLVGVGYGIFYEKVLEDAFQQVENPEEEAPLPE